MSTPLDPQTIGSPIIATPEVLGSLLSGSDVPSNILDLLDDNTNFMIESHENAPGHNYGGTMAAERFRRVMEGNYPGITKRMKEIPGAANMMKDREGRRRLMMVAFAERMRDQGRPPRVLTDNEGLIELLDAYGIETLETREFKQEIQKGLEKGQDLSDPNKPPFNREAFDRAASRAAEVEQRRSQRIARPDLEQNLLEKSQPEPEQANRIKSPSRDIDL